MAVMIELGSLLMCDYPLIVCDHGFICDDHYRLYGKRIPGLAR